MANQELILQVAHSTFTDSTGKIVPFTSYYVVIAGIAIKLKPVDGTAKAILDGFFK